jgi:hypothetical protein
MSYVKNTKDKLQKKISSFLYTVFYNVYVGRDNAVGIATRYGLDGLGIKSR